MAEGVAAGQAKDDRCGPRAWHGKSRDVVRVKIYLI